MPMVRPRLRPGQGDICPRQVIFFAQAQTRLWKILPGSASGSTGGHFESTVARFPTGAEVRRSSPTPSGDAGATMAHVAIELRDYRPDDFESLWRMDQQCFPPGISYSQQELRGFIQHRGSFTLIATNEKEELQGFIVAHCGVSGHIVTIDVGPGARRSGVGSLLLRRAEERMRGAKCRFVDLETAVDNRGALAFYKRHGYDVIYTWPRYYSNGVDALVLKKNLN
jgi:ribosomal-protein-alanine N-acetyltransferase